MPHASGERSGKGTQEHAMHSGRGEDVPRKRGALWEQHTGKNTHSRRGEAMERAKMPRRNGSMVRCARKGKQEANAQEGRWGAQPYGGGGAQREFAQDDSLTLARAGGGAAQRQRLSGST